MTTDFCDGLTEYQETLNHLALHLIDHANRDFSAEGETFGTFVRNFVNGEEHYGIPYTTVEVPDPAERHNAIRHLLQLTRKEFGTTGEVVGIWHRANIWLTDADGVRTEARQVALVDLDGQLIAQSLAPDGTLCGMGADLNAIPSKHISAVMLSALRGTKAPHCYMCHGKANLTRYGGVWTAADGSQVTSGQWACEDLDACVRRSARKFTERQQREHLSTATEALLRMTSSVNPGLGEQLSTLLHELDQL